ncbi:hypothetical protein O6H91_17G059800 [Diphasiastrum complanatum]|uniref:Uncharacterized protein n=1 Tax=Diphasiastrum complanatum TaxID=34168 RepID=A0ACC2B778_DIPCM|nr:hypothetical protein O6H91_17G059800 [Diphasiastrum complanatum]
MANITNFLWKVEEGVENPGVGRPSKGPVYRNIQSKHSLATPKPGVTTWVSFSETVKRSPNNNMLGHREIVDGKAGKYVWQTYQEVYDEVLHLGSALRAAGVPPKGRCGVYGANSPEWMKALQACSGQSISIVPLYDTLGADAVEFIIKHAEVSIAFVQQSKLPAILKTFPNVSSILKTIVSFGEFSEEQTETAKKQGVTTYSWKEFMELGVKNPSEFTTPTPEDISTIMYTSGTSGDPKGVILTHECLTSVVAGLDSFFNDGPIKFADEEAVYFSFLPLAHSFDRALEELFVSKGSSIGYWQCDVRILLEDMAELKPTFLGSVPRVLDRIYQGIQAKTSNAGVLQKRLFDIGYKHKLIWMQRGYKHTEASPLFDMLIFSKVRQSLGGRLQMIVSGGAPLAKHVEEFLSVVTCASIVQGYGLTETCAGSFIAVPNVISMKGNVGPPLPNIEVCLESIPEMNYDALASTQQGEVCIRGKTVFKGYHKRDDLTCEAVIDGWFHTGDVGEWQPDGSLKIIDRKKNIFKLSQGEYVAVENLENIFGLSPVIDTIWVYGNSLESVLVAVVIPNKDLLETWAKENGEEGNYEALCQRPKAKEFIINELNAVAKKSKLRGFEYIKLVHLESEPFTIERNLMTPTFKLKRPELLKCYKETLNGLYASLKK